MWRMGPEEIKHVLLPSLEKEVGLEGAPQA